MTTILQTDDGKQQERIGGKIKDYKRSEKEESQLGQSEAARFDEGKNRLDLMPPWSIDQVAQVYTYGTIKYDDDNWWKGMPWKKVIGPLLRHIWKWLRGEKWDDESGLHHLAHAAWQCLALMEYERNGIGKDNRVPYTLDLMDEEQRNNRINTWKKLASIDRLKEYNGMNADVLIKMCDRDCSVCSKIEDTESKLDS